MKKLLGISLIAMMAVTSANAEIASKAYVDQQDGQLSTLKTTAKDNLVAAINELSDKAGETSVADQIAAAVDQTYNASSTKAQSGTAVAGAITNMQTTTNLSSNMTTDTGSTSKYPSVAAVEAAIATEATARADADTAINTKIGTVPAGKDVVTMISEAQTAATPGIATTSATGVVKGGGNVAIANDGTLSVADASDSAKGLIEIATDTEATTGTATDLAVNPKQLKVVADAVSDEATARADADTAINTKIGSGTISAKGDDGQTAAADLVSAVNAIDSRLADAASVADDAQTAAEVATAIDTKVGTLDLGTVTGTGVVTDVDEQDGIVSVTKADPLTTMDYDTFASGQDFGDGSYSLTMKVVSGTPTYKWELIERASGE